MTIEIARAASEDLDDVCELFAGYRAFYGVAGRDEQSAQFLAQRLTGGDAAIYLAREVTSPAARLPVGFVQLYAGYSSLQLGAIWTLNDLYVAKSHRGLGVGRMLMIAARRHAVETGACQIALSTANDNRTAQSLYESLGYVPDVAFRHYVLSLASPM